MDPVQEGFALEELIHKASLKLPSLIHSKREKEILTYFTDNSFNGVDHWIQIGTTHFLIQDKWKETITQQEVAQFLTCTERMKERLSNNHTYHYIWCSKKEPTSNSYKLLSEKNVNIITCSSRIENLARNVIMEICDILEVDPNECLIEIKSKSKQQIQTTNYLFTPIITFDDSDDGKKMIEDMKNYIDTIQNNVIRKIMQANSIDCVYEVNSIINFPNTKDDWWSGKYSKIDFNAFMKAVKTVCWPTNKKKLRSTNLFFYVKMRKLSCELSKFINEYEMKRKNLLNNKSAWAKNLPTLKCNPEPISEAEFKGAIENCDDYWINTMANGQIKKIPNSGIIHGFYGYQCNVY